MNKAKSRILTTLIISVIAVSLMMSSVLAAATPVDTNDLKTANTLRISGSSTVYEITKLTPTAYKTWDPYITGLTLDSVGTGPGLTDYFMPGLCDIAVASSVPTAAQGFTDIPDMRIWVTGIDSVAIIVPAGNTWLTQADTATIANIFRCKQNNTDRTPLYTNWNEVPGLTGAPNAPIERYTRQGDSGTTDGFNKYFMKAAGYDLLTYLSWIPDGVHSHTGIETNELMLSSVAGDANAIGYIGLGFIEGQSQVNGINIKNPDTSAYVAPTKTNVLNQSYKTTGGVVKRYLWFCTNGVPTLGTPGAHKAMYISYVRANMSLYVTGTTGYMPVPKGDFVGGNSSSTGNLLIDPTQNGDGAYHPTLPDGKVNFDDLLYFITGYVNNKGSAHKIDPYCDFDCNGQVNFDDLLAFIASYVVSPH